MERREKGSCVAVRLQWVSLTAFRGGRRKSKRTRGVAGVGDVARSQMRGKKHGWLV